MVDHLFLSSLRLYRVMRKTTVRVCRSKMNTAPKKMKMHLVAALVY